MIKKHYLKIFLLFFILGLIIYANSFQNQFFWDDNDNIVNNIYIRSWRFLPNYFTENLIAGADLHSNYWRPLLLFSFSLDYKIWKINPFGYHLTNTLLHIFNAFLIYLLLFLIFKNKPISFLTALIFLLHPLQTEAITYMAGRGDPLSIFFILLSFIFYHLGRAKNKPKFLFLSCLFFICALLTKESAIIFPGLILLYEILFFWFCPVSSSNKERKAKIKTGVIYLLPIFLTAFVYFLLRLTVLNFGETLNLYGETNIFTQNIHYRIFTFLKILPIYYSLYFAPIHLHMERSVEIITTLFHPAVIISLILFVLMIFFSIYFLKKGNKLFAFGSGLFFISLFPFSNILIPVSALLYEHWLYFSLVGLSLIFSYLICSLLNLSPFTTFSSWLSQLKEKGDCRIKVLRFIVLGFLVCFFFFLSIRTILRNFDWKDPITFYNQTLKYSETARVHNNLAMAYSDKGEFGKAISHYKRAIEISDIYSQIHNNFGNAYKEIGQFKEAIEEFEIAIKMDPSFFVAYNNLAELYFGNKEYDKVIGVYQRYLKIAPTNLNVLYNLGIVYYINEDYDNAISTFEKILEFQPGNIQILNLISQIQNEKNKSQ